MKLIRLRLAILVTGLAAVFLGWVMRKAWLFAIALGAMGCPHRVIALRRDWPDKRRGYIQSQLKDFSDHTRDNPFSQLYMWGATANLSSATAHDLAFYFSTLSPQAANDGYRELEEKGREIYQLGMPDSNTAACVVCHGPNAEGVGEIPRLGGLAYTYLKRRLEQWGQGYHGTARPPMPRIASKLSANQIEVARLRTSVSSSKCDATTRA